MLRHLYGDKDDLDGAVRGAELAGDAASTDGDAVLPDRFTERARQISANTLVHIPKACRVRMATAATQCWEGMAAGMPGWCALEEARSKLLLSGIPDGAHVRKEVAIRLGMWERRAFGELLNRAPDQLSTELG